MTMTDNSDHHKRLRERSGSVNTSSNLVAFFYELLRDHVPAGTVETVAINSSVHNGGQWALTNGWLANYAKDLVNRLLFSEQDLKSLEFINAMITMQRPGGLTEEGKKTWDDARALVKRLRTP